MSIQPAAAKKPGLLRRMRHYRNIYLMLLPVIIFYILFHYVPMGGLAIAFENYKPAKGILGSDWVGLKNFRKFLTGIYAWRVIRNTLTELCCANGIREYALSETQKYGHVTYFWNGNRSGKVDESLEDYAEVPSDVIPFEQAPAMKSVEITDLLVEAMASHKYQFLRCNYPNGDMVGHTGVLSAVITAMEAVDAALARVKEAADKYGYTLLVTADHGNADQMLETKKGKTSVRTAHSLNPVPFIIYDPDNKYEIKDGHYGLANVAPTIVTMMGLETPDCWQPSMI